MNQTKVFVIKLGKNRTEEFSPDKLHASIAASCLAVNAPDGQAEDLARQITVSVMDWCQTRPEITSSDIRRQALQRLQPLHQDAADLYEQYKSII